MKMKILLLLQAILKNYFGINVTFGSISDTSPQCQEEFKTLDKKILVQMLDASSKSFDGLLQINPYHFGNFDECYSIEHKIDDRITYGKYCLGTLSSGDIIAQAVKYANYGDLLPLYKHVNNTPFGFRVGICIPHRCSARDAEKVISFLKFDEDWCYSRSKETPLTTLAWVTIAIFSILIGLVAAATVCEFILNTRERKVPKYVLPFSFISNWKSLITPRFEEHPLSCLSGIKALSAAWVVLGHTCAMSFVGPVENLIFIKEILEDIGSTMFVFNAFLAVDTFLALGGIVLVYAYLTIRKGKNIKINILFLYIYRYVRLTPLLAIVVLVQANMAYLGSGPLWGFVENVMAKSCHEEWWTPLLYVLNWFPDKLLPCAPHSWYLSVDFQLFLFSPIVLILLHRKPKVGLTVLGFLIFLGFLVPFAISYIHQLTMYISWDYIVHIVSNIDPIEKVKEYNYTYYFSPFSRFGPYVIGLLGGYIIYNATERKSKIVIRPVTVKWVWFLIIFGILSCIFGPYKFFFFYDRLSHALITVFIKNIWAALVTCMVFMCAIGYGGFINDFLCHPIFQFIAKLTYCIYLIHAGVIIIRIGSLRTTFIASHYSLISAFCGDFTITLILSIFSSLIFEIPFVKVMHTLMLGYHAPEKKTETDKTDKTD